MSAPDGSLASPDRDRSKRVVIVGGVAGGMSTATRLRRLDADAEIIVLERSGHVSFANCGLPYFVGGLIEKEDDLTLQTPEQLFARFRLDVRVNDEVVAIDRAAHTVTARSTLSGDEEVLVYDKLVLSMGAAPVRPPIPGYDRARTLRTVEDAARLASDVGVAPKTAVIIGAGFIGLEMAENLVPQRRQWRRYPPGDAHRAPQPRYGSDWPPLLSARRARRST
jgi:NADPH-dependent 2,4-dienoyl-CoA reductase/sulfur reductase-like enzyme